MAAGNNVDDAKELFDTNDINKRIVSEDDFGRAARKVSHILRDDFIDVFIIRLLNWPTSRRYNKAETLKFLFKTILIITYYT